MLKSINLSRNFSETICLSAIIFFFISGCYSQHPEMSGSNHIDTEDDRQLTPDDLNAEFPNQAVDKLKDVVTKTMLPKASGKNKAELNKILKYLKNIQKEGPDYFNDSKNLILLLTTGGRVSHILATLNPDNFDVNLNLSLQYLHIARTLDQIERYDPSEDGRRLSKEYRYNGIQTAQELVKKYPDNGVSYGHLAHSLYTTGGDSKRALDLYKHCLELDKELEFCQKGYDVLLKKLKPSSP